MKKSEIFKKAQLSVLKDNSLTSEEKLEIVKFFMGEETFQLFLEENKNESEEQDNG